ncbi:MAG: hypothetical protein DRJ51_03815 [Thermoprotei archaeon]|nr:MAG: hypothetical protein DRJ51_03815 [Thermoprotei archaeon]
MEVLLGVDGGGTRTEALTVDLKGRIVGYGTAGPSNINLVGVEAAEREVVLAIKRALKPGLRIRRAVLGFAGAGRKGSLEKYTAIVKKLGFQNFTVTTDGFISLIAATQFNPGVMVSAGTGTITMGIDGGGRVVRASGWGYLVGDEGSGFWIGSRILNMLSREIDGRSDVTGLADIVFKWFKVEDFDSLLEKIYSSKNPVVLIASLLEAVQEVWHQHPVLYNIIQEAARELALGVAAVVKRLDLKPPVKVYYGGGVFNLGERFIELFTRELKKLIGAVSVHGSTFKPVFGAVLYAFKLEGVDLEKVLEKLSLESTELKDFSNEG